MDTYNRVIITGGLGFIGSNLVRFLNARKIRPIIIDSFDSYKDSSRKNTWKNVLGLSFDFIDQSEVWKFDEEKHSFVLKGVLEELRVNNATLIHLGASVDTTEEMNRDLWHNNVVVSQRLMSQFYKNIYASSAAVYGAEESNFSETTWGRVPLNAYGFTKYQVDSLLADGQIHAVGLRFFNVYGPNEGHKGNMKSVVSKALNGEAPICAAKDGNVYSLFKSKRAGIAHGDQKRDFVYVEDVCKVIYFMMVNYHKAMGKVYNLGSGEARSFNDLIRAVNSKAQINYIDMPECLQGQYQYFTQADLTSLRALGYTEEFTSLEQGIEKTAFQNYLTKKTG